MATRKQTSSGPRTEAKNERQLFLAGLFRKGVPQAQIYRVMIAKFGVTVQTVRKDVKALGLAARRVMDAEETIEAETAAALDRLKARAQRDDAAGAGRSGDGRPRARGDRPRQRPAKGQLCRTEHRRWSGARAKANTRARVRRRRGR